MGAASLIPGHGEPYWQGITVELSTGWAGLVGVALQEGVLVAVQVVHQVTIAAVFGDKVDGPCRKTGLGTDSGGSLILPSMATRPLKSLGRHRWQDSKEAGCLTNPGPLPVLCAPKLLGSQGLSLPI